MCLRSPPTLAVLSGFFDGSDNPVVLVDARSGESGAPVAGGAGEGGTFLRRLEDLEDFGEGWLDLDFFTGVDGIGGKVWRLEDLVVLPDASDGGTLGDAALP